MILQNFIFPRESICMEEDLYFHTKENACTYLNDILYIAKGNKVDFFSYFNGFSLGKWRRYALDSEIQCKITLVGECVVYLNQYVLDGEQLKVTCLDKQEITGNQSRMITLTVPESCIEGICSTTIEAKEDVQLIKAAFCTYEEIRNPVNLLIGICTYHREPFVKTTLNRIKDEIMADKTLLTGHVQVVVADNGQTLDTDGWEDYNIHIVKNKNVGGAGGFARCMVEALTTFMDWHPTHVIFMDDDILLEPEILYRTYLMLSYLKKEYKEYVLGGGLLRMDIPYIQHANGERWENCQIGFTKRGYNLKNQKTLLNNEEELPIDYCGWWYCCIPINEGLDKSLPLPIFIHADDIEYGLRQNGKFITLNGIGVWHDAFENRKSSSMEYYDMRNSLLCSFIHMPDFSVKEMQKKVCRYLIYQLLKYRYMDQELTILGVEHVLQGIDFFKKTDPVTLHKEIIKKGYHGVDVRNELHTMGIINIGEAPEETEIYCEGRFCFKHICSLNGWLLPGKREVQPVFMGAHPSMFTRAKRVLYFEPETGNGFFVERRYREIFYTLKKCIKIRRLIRKNFEKAAKDIRTNWRELTSLEFWMYYLGK